MFSNICLAGFLSFLKTSIFVVGYISGGTLFPEPLRAEEEKEALIKMKEGDEEARNLLIERNLRLVAHVCKKYSNTNVDQDDLLSIGTIGQEERYSSDSAQSYRVDWAIKSVSDRFDPKQTSRLGRKVVFGTIQPNPAEE